ncbi:pentatricopeptide repeat-containing protein At5g19020, mitochondrial [Cucurbita moschata]|uniref:Pentatricopeptide repeat-containing protein At5g19020, mitochondrial n=1 Tax=Cucurbita moschata TaxID=3662 RepID=A0A6J1H4P4_CUCMO|nr:pentatricopeptide repeat-containing protein At5g19020, mitochondrial [Cucurbita moschata]
MPVFAIPKLFSRRITIPLSFTSLYPKWVSTFSTIGPSSRPLHNLTSFFNGRPSGNCLDYELSLVSALKYCASSSAIFQGQQIHATVLKSGFDSNTFILNSLINMYAKCGHIADARLLFDSCSGLDSVSCNIMLSGYVKLRQLENARQLFDKMPERGCVSYTTMILGLAQNDCWREAIEIFKDMRSAGVAPNEVTIASVMSACSHIGGIWNCLMLHALVIKLHFIGLVLISTNLLHMYCVCSSLKDARRLFNEMPMRNTVSWNVMLKGYVKSGLVDKAIELFDRIPERDVISWATMIDGFVQVKQLREALSMFSAMRKSDLHPNEVMIVDLLSACGQSISIDEGRQLHSIIVKTGFDCYDFMQATLISFYSACGRIELANLQYQVSDKSHLATSNALIVGFMKNRMIDQARQIFDVMPAKDVFSWSTMISGYAQNELPDMALELFHGMVVSGLEPNEITMVSVFSAIAASGKLAEGRWAHEYVCNKAIPLNDNLSAAVIDMYAKCGSISTAMDMFYQIRDKASTVSPWNAIICGLAMHGHANLSLEIFSDLQGRSIKLNSITFLGVLGACCHAGLVELGERYFWSMKSVYGVEPNIKHYGCLVDLLGRAARLREAEETIRTMPMKADVVIWGTLLAACRTHGEVEIGERAAENLARLEPSHGAGRVLLSNLYADAGLWEDASLVRKAMQSQRMIRSPGCSGVV